MKKIILCLLAAGTFLCSCEDFLEPRDKSVILENKLFTNQEGAEEAMYGLYTSLGSTGLYGHQIPYTLDLLGQYYTIKRGSGTSTVEDITAHRHETAIARGQYEAIWAAGYKLISDVNKMVEALDTWSGKPLKHKNVYYGECFGIRALMHFDLLRMFGSIQQDKRGIPYVTRYGMGVTPFSTTGDCYKKVIEDLKAAETLLGQDSTWLTYPRLPEDITDPYTSDRQFHLNLYAVKALLARVYWTRNNAGDLDSAAKYASEIINSKKFPLPADANRINGTYFIRMMSGTVETCEAILGIYIEDTYKTWGPAYVHKTVNQPSDPALYVVPSFEVGMDYRSNWIRTPDVPGAATNDYAPCYMKLIAADRVNIKDEARKPIGFNGVNIIRVPEMYLILTEALLSKQPDEAMTFFMDYLYSRGITIFNGTLNEEIIDSEFKKEFAQEGQYWLRLKRRQVPEIKLEPTLNKTLQMDESKWNLTIPDGEFEYRPEGSY